jgi:hypothetical protein
VDQLAGVLRQVGLQEFIYGDKVLVLGPIEESFNAIKNRKVERYINASLEEDHAVEVNCWQWYQLSRACSEGPEPLGRGPVDLLRGSPASIYYISSIL